MKGPTMTLPFRDPRLPVRQRVDDLLARLAPEERLALLHQHAPAVPRLGLAAFRTGTEAAHGVAWLGPATVFPQPVGLAASWDPDLLRRVGRAVGREVRAKHLADPAVSLNVWAPVVNPLRHPLWGRNEEGFSEDPHLTAELATGYCAGLRGDHPRVWQTVPTLKHFLAYGNESWRATSSSQLRERVLHEHELPAFRGPVQAGVAGAAMLAYNLVDGVPAHVSPLVREHLRAWADDPDALAVVTDAGAPGNLVRAERWAPDLAAADAAALLAGVDCFTDDGDDPGPTLRALRTALERGLIAQEDVDAAARRLLTLRVRTGELDDPGALPDGEEPACADVRAEDVGRPEHVALAREAAAAGAVLLRNRGGLLPLPRTGTVAVVGPLADAVLTDWYSGTPTASTSLVAALRGRLGAEAVRTADGSDLVSLRHTASDRFVTAAGDGALLAAAGAAGEDARFEVTQWADGVMTLRHAATGRLVTRGEGALAATADRVGGWVVQETFRVHAEGGTCALLHLGTGRWVAVDPTTGALVPEAAERAGAARFVLRTHRAGTAAAVQAAAGADHVLVVVGNDPHVAGRETEDRATLALPHASAELVRAVREVAPHAVLVLVSSYPYALGGLLDGLGAVLWSSHAGQQLGEGLADVLLGEVEPSGRLPQTWFRDDADLPDLLDHDALTARSGYAWAERGVQFPLGHGLGYGGVTYRSVRTSAPAAAAGEEVLVQVELEGEGERAVAELVQVYATAPGLAVPFPRRRLVAHRRVRVEPGTRARVELRVPVERLAVRDVARGETRALPGTYHLLVGSSAEDVRAEVALTVTGEAPAPRELLRAGAFDACDGVELVPREGPGTTARTTARTAVRAALPGGGAWLEFTGCAAAGVVALRCCARGARAGEELVVRVRGTSGAWLPAGRAPLPAGAWGEVDVPLHLPAGERCDLRLVLPGGTLLDELDLVRADAG
ncbi:beta-glucosidase family protein [Kineococcus indalonis]|uniref:beta-glucosidase family protein n=1 Tax=Kineococcus indalonis TaxID=2696566 RepID=UPI00196A83C8|nr:glycoside hydrolase family 3 C-terminal domain-containing protein [Kineococcus indalonis]